MGKIRLALNAILESKNELERRITQKQIADYLHCSQSAVSQYLTGESAMTDEIVEKFCDFLCVKLGDLENWNPELAKIRFQLSPMPSSVCPQSNKEHISYHEMLERILHKGEKKWANGIIANIEAMHDKSLLSENPPPKRKHGPGRPTDDLGPGNPLFRRKDKRDA
jgi:predicted transcriptional regulator